MAGKISLLVLALVTLLSFLPGIVIADIEILPKTGVPTLARWVPTPVHNKRTGPNACNADNCLRALRRFSTSAVPFCSSFLHIPKSTVTTTVTTTTMPGYTVSQTTSVDTTTTSTVTVFETTTTTTTQSVTPTFTAPSQPTKRSERNSDDAKKGKEDENKDRDDKALPSYVSEYPTARISSACSCLSIPPSTTTTTSTSTVTSPTPATTVVQTNTNTITATTTTTSTITSTSTISTTVCPAPTRVPGANGVALAPVGGQYLGTIQFPNVQNPEDCCLACYDPSRSSNCVVFAGGPGFCFLIVNSGGSNPSPVCPAGLGPGTLLADISESSTNFGGPGPCAGPGFSSVPN